MNAKPLPAASTAIPLPSPLEYWLTSFDYVFGFQLKLVQDYWGLSAGARR